MTSSDLQSNPIRLTALTIQNELKSLPQLRKVLSGHNQRVFSTDLALVAHCLRTGYLVDLVAPKEPIETFSSLISTLRANQHTKDLFVSVLHVYEPSSEQSFFVNVKLLCDGIQPLLSIQINSTNLSGSPPLFIRLGSQIEVLERTPDNLLQILDRLLLLRSTSEPLPLSFSLPADTSIEDAVPLAAVLLDYPIAYIPSSSAGNSLSGVPLHLYECILGFIAKEDGPESDIKQNTYTIMKFSCPAQMAEKNPDQCQPEKLISQLKEMFTRRIQKTGNTGLVVDITYITRTPDHITF